jgi:hypothetical protein
VASVLGTTRSARLATGSTLWLCLVISVGCERPHSARGSCRIRHFRPGRKRRLRAMLGGFDNPSRSGGRRQTRCCPFSIAAKYRSYHPTIPACAISPRAQGSRGLKTTPRLAHSLTRRGSCARISCAVAAVAQLVEHLTENQGVPSSSLGCGTRIEFIAACGRGSVVEHLLAKERVVGSNPIARSLFKSAEGPRRRSQVERQRSAKPRSRVQIPSSPLCKWAGSKVLSAVCLCRGAVAEWQTLRT